MNLSLQKYINGIEEVNKEAYLEARKRLDSLAKPLGSLGSLEDIAAKIASITGELYNNINKKCVIVMSSDNGVVKEGVASAPQIVTLSQTINFTRGLTGVCVIAKANDTDIKVYDVGINSDMIIPGVENKKIRKGTSNIAEGPAMTYEEAEKGILIGIEAVKTCKDEGYDLIGVGEMGIGNTTTSSAVLASILGVEPKLVTGKGGGITEESFKKKNDVIKKAIEINKPNDKDAIDVLSKVGGFDIAAMTGVYLGAAYYKIPVCIDGFISVVAAVMASKLNPLCKDYMLPSHCSKEIGYNLAIKELELEPILNLHMRLGEGSGCPIAFNIIQSSVYMMNNMATFEEANINTEYLEAVRGPESYIVKQ